MSSYHIFELQPHAMKFLRNVLNAKKKSIEKSFGNFKCWLCLRYDLVTLDSNVKYSHYILTIIIIKGTFDHNLR